MTEEQKPPVAPSLGELFERSLSGLLLGRSAYAALAERPAPSYGALTVLALGFAVSGLALNVALTAISQPALLGRYPAAFYLAVGAAALGICLAGLLLSSALLYGLGKALGGDGGFERGYQAAAMLFALAPVQALTGLLPLAWTAPSVLFAWAGAGALAGLLRAGFPGALAACAMLAGLSVAGQAVARAAYAKSQQRFAQASAVMSAEDGAAAAAALLQTLQAQQLAQPGRPGEMPTFDASALGAPPSAASGASSLDLLRGGGENAPSGEVTPAQEKAMLQQGDALRANAEGMIASILPMLDNPAITKNLDAQGKADMAEIRNLLATIKTQSAANAINAKDHAQMMQRIQEITMRLMMSSMKGAAPAAPAPEKKR